MVNQFYLLLWQIIQIDKIVRHHATLELISKARLRRNVRRIIFILNYFLSQKLLLEVQLVTLVQQVVRRGDPLRLVQAQGVVAARVLAVLERILDEAIGQIGFLALQA